MSSATERPWRQFESMLLIRRFEEALVGLHREGAFTSHYHLYIGQEATGVATIDLLEGKDRLATTHRGHGHVLARGADPGKAFAEILGRVDGLTGGYGGTIHLSAPELGFVSTSGIVAGTIGLAIGAGFSCRQKGEGGIAAAFFGDGSLEEGLSFEALNIASLWKLPVLFVCENNSRGAMGMAKGGYPTLVHSATDLCQIPATLGIETVRVDGSDLDAVHAVMTDAVAKCRSGSGPIFVEAVTPRWAGSSPLWPALLTGVTDLRMAWGETSTGGEHQDWYETYDPILKTARRLGTDPAARPRLLQIDAAISERIARGIAFAKASPLPAGSDVLTKIFATVQS